MPAQILSTKLSTPPMRPRLVSRPHLIQRLNQGLECGFLLISAPAGYGKSTLISTWLAHQEFDSTWLSLDEGDNDPFRFFTYLVAALQVIDPTIDEVFDSNRVYQDKPDVESLLTPLINKLSGINHPFCLILDDYHLIQNQTVHQAVNFLLEHRPVRLHIVISTRADPPLPLARMRVRSGIMELRMADLRFSTQEAADFLIHTMGLKVSDEDVARLTIRTEGWIAGLQMAALSMQYTDDISGFISTLSGSHHYIFDYLLEEILSKQSDECRRFLLHTSILDQLTAPLCDALVKVDDESVSTRPSSIILDELEHANLFIIPLDHEQHWYRYHPLLVELLRGYLQQMDPARIPTLHTRASIWFEEQGLISLAIRHSFAASDWERIVRLIGANIFALLEQNELNSVARQLENLTHKTNLARPWLLVGRAWLAAYTGQLSTVEPILKLAEGEFDGLNSEAELQTLGGHIAAIRAYAYWIGDKRDIAEKAARAALEWLPESEYLLRCQAATLLGLVLNDFTHRNQVFKQALDYARKCSVSHVTIFAHGCWAWSLCMQGRLHDAYAACHEAIQLAGSSRIHQPLPTLSHVYSTLSFVHCEWNDIDPALRYSKDAVNLARQWEQADALHFALDNLGYAFFAAGEVEDAFDVLRQTWSVARRTSAWFEEITISQEVEWHLALGNMEGALHAIQLAKVDINEASIIHLNSYKSMLMPLTIVQIFMAQKEYSKALALLGNLLEEIERKGAVHYLIRLLAWQAMAYHGLRQETQAQMSLKRAVTIAAPEGYIRTFINIGRGLMPLLHWARSTGITPGYIDLLLAAFDKEAQKHPSDAGSSLRLVKSLSEREMDVMKLLAHGYSDKKIAMSLSIARETVHKHLKNIYGKLDVHSRSEAIVRARELNLI